jgi:hypothetical protein
MQKIRIRLTSNRVATTKLFLYSNAAVHISRDHNMKLGVPEACSGTALSVHVLCVRHVSHNFSKLQGYTNATNLSNNSQPGPQSQIHVWIL